MVNTPSADDEKLSAIADNLSRFQIWAGTIEVAQRILELLEELDEVNEEVRAIVSGDRQDAANEDDSDDGTGPDTESVSELSESCLSVSDIITSLHNVSALLRRATGWDHFAKAAAAKELRHPEHFDERLVAEIFPKVNHNLWLRERLGRANVQRRQYLQYARENHARATYEASSLQSETAQPFPLNPDNIKNSTVRIEQLNQLDVTGSQGTSVGNHPDRTTDMVQLSQLAQGGEPFECPSWSALAAHLHISHPTLPTELFGAIIDCSSRPVSEIEASACLLCDEWQQELDAKAMRSSPKKDVVAPVRDFRRHLGQHLEQLALFTIDPRPANTTVFGPSNSQQCNDNTADVQDIMDMNAQRLRQSVVSLKHSLRQHSPLDSTIERIQSVQPVAEQEQQIKAHARRDQLHGQTATFGDALEDTQSLRVHHANEQQLQVGIDTDLHRHMAVVGSSSDEEQRLSQARRQLPTRGQFLEALRNLPRPSGGAFDPNPTLNGRSVDLYALSPRI
ncbi:hypothetical protein CBER1_08351 [Cercospora berteroae]|uniref:Uncharacterized protein n=1 Tax=Cercospora berteroae TaxID=357750 RepID=A0A2S6CFH0_9PEZI|nr:hypothetical protein CBER1_08351 [Cercospora berteroae]